MFDKWIVPKRIPDNMTKLEREGMDMVKNSYCQNMGGTKFQPREFPRSGSKVINVKRKKERKSLITMVSF